MKYMGGKSRLARHIVPVMLQARKPGQTWVEPFVGGGSVIERVSCPRIGADDNPNTISALASIRDHLDELPRNSLEFTEADYKRMLKGWDYAHKGFAGFAYSFGAKYRGGWSRNSRQQDYVQEAYNSAARQSPKLRGVKLIVSDYRELQIPARSLVYCDPPYHGATKYRANICHNEFWDWCRAMATAGHTLFVSEYTAPPDFVLVFTSTQANSIAPKSDSRKAAECLFMYAPELM